LDSLCLLTQPVTIQGSNFSDVMFGVENGDMLDGAGART
jgi:hypothetical protein